MIKISAVVCTRNRAGYLQKALESLAKQSLERQFYEVLVVDNGSTDETARVTEEAGQRYGNVRYICEPCIGLSPARNTGWRNACGEYVAYLDDDALACREWLEKILEVFQTIQPRPGMVGGRIELIWEAPRPAWLPDWLLVLYGHLNISQVPVSSGDALIVFGGNAAYPRELLQAVGGFDTRVGRKGGSLVSNDEALLWLQVKERGYRAFYHPQILIHHHVQAQRLNQRFVLRRMFWQGVSDEVTQQILQPPTLKGRIARASASARALSLSPRRIRNFLAAAANPALFSARCHYAYKLGRARGLLPLGL